MSQFNTPPVRFAGGSLDVYSGLLFVAMFVLAIGVFVVATSNIEHSKVKDGNQEGGVFKLIE